MKPYVRLTRARQRRECMCIRCGAVRPSLHLPRLEVDAITRTFLPLIALSLLTVAAQGHEEARRQASGSVSEMRRIHKDDMHRERMLAA